MSSGFKHIKKGNICSAKGFLSGSIYSGIKSPGLEKKILE